MGGMSVYGMDTGAGPSFPEGLYTNDSVSEFILFNNLLYNLHFFVGELVYLENPHQRWHVWSRK